jgi:hypothetical protein
MKRSDIRSEIENTLKLLGFKKGQYKWTGCTLDLVIGHSFKTMRFPSGMSRRALIWELARLTGWVEVLSDNYTAVNPMLKVKSKPARKARLAILNGEGAIANA